MEKVISLDIGGTNLRAALINSNYQIEKVIKKDNNTFGDLDKFYEEIINLIRDLNVNLDEVSNISIGVPGRVRHNGMIDALPNIGIENIDLKTKLKTTFNKDVYIKNDAEMGLLAEAVLGAGKDYDGVYFITISTGVGGAFAYKGELKNYGKEIGHIPVLYKNEYYDFESICSGGGIVRLSKMNGLRVKNSKEFFDLVRKENKKALSIFNTWIELFSSFLRYIKDIYNPDIFTFTGGVFKNKDLIFPKLKENNPSLNMVECYFEENAGLIGGAVYGFQRERNKV
ncbi:MAG: ROK family protein [Coprobacillus sp.]|nr:ROK family protein [Coprobacillus sp.]